MSKGYLERLEGPHQHYRVSFPRDEAHFSNVSILMSSLKKDRVAMPQGVPLPVREDFKGNKPNPDNFVTSLLVILDPPNKTGQTELVKKVILLRKFV